MAIYVVITSPFLKLLTCDFLQFFEICSKKNEISLFKTKDEQLSWERDCYINSNVILFWVPRKFPSMLGLTTNVEFGYWLKSKKCIYGRPDYAYRTDYLDWLYNLEYNKKPINSLEELLKQAVKMSKGEQS